jgi:phosphonopyruvate decarboxylase
VARACGYPKALTVSDEEGLASALEEARTSDELIFIEIKCQVGARADLGRPTTTAIENKNNFMEYING